jgi:hypothetical protein
MYIKTGGSGYLNLLYVAAAAAFLLAVMFGLAYLFS